MLKNRNRPKKNKEGSDILGREGFEHLLGFHAAPTFTGLKPGSLLSFHRSNFQDFEGLLSSYEHCFKCKGISVFRLVEEREFILILFYRERDLKETLEKTMAQEILSRYGYQADGSLWEKLEYLRERMRISKSFPHEVGLFLGYPPEDVAGFIEHRGRSFSYSGYWKVYTNEEETRKLFDRYTRCTRDFCCKLDMGMKFSELLTAG